MGIVELCNKIKNSKKGFYLHFKFEAEPTTILDLKKEAKLDNMVIRDLIVKYKKLDTENEFDIFGKPHKNSKIEPSKILNNKYNLEDKDIVDIINIYNRVLKLYIVVLKYNTKIPNFITKQYIDLYYLSNDNIDNIDNIPSVYNNIYNYSKHNYSNTYLDYIIINREYDVYIKIIDIYFYLIGYI